MSKRGSIFFCQNCGTSSTKWLGKCPACGAWNSFVEEKTRKKDAKKDSFKSTKVNTDEHYGSTSHYYTHKMGRN